jgi:hypothetical protein
VAVEAVTIIVLAVLLASACTSSHTPQGGKLMDKMRGLFKKGEDEVACVQRGYNCVCPSNYPVRTRSGKCGKGW